MEGVLTMFKSILFQNEKDRTRAENSKIPGFFVDLNLDQIVDAITDRKGEYDLKSFFYTKLEDTDSIKYRQEVMQDLENEQLFDDLRSFGDEMRSMRQHIDRSKKLSYKYQKERWFLDAVEIYCDAVSALKSNISAIDLNSRGFLSFREYITGYVNSNAFKSLTVQTKNLKDALSKIRYTLLVKGNTIKVKRYKSEKDYSREVEKTFEKFKQGSVKDHSVKFNEIPEMNHIEAKILDFVAALYPEVFSKLDSYYTQNYNYADEIITTFDREIQFYIAYLEFISKFKRNGLHFCYPRVSSVNKKVDVRQTFDLALANKLISNEKTSIVCNDFYLKGKERIFVVTGPNQGGKTTFSRTFGQLHYLASIGCTVPGKTAELFLFDNIFTHFEREENINDLRGKLEDDLFRINTILKQATPKSILIMNEIFSSTTLKDALFLSEKIMKKIVDLDLLAVWVTFVDEIASMNEKVVSMVSTVVPDNPTLRTYKIVRKPANGLSYAISIAEKYHLTYDDLKERIKP